MSGLNKTSPSVHELAASPKRVAFANTDNGTSANNNPNSTLANLPETENERNETNRRRRWQTVAGSLFQLSPSIVLENSGSVARDHLASERTFLAYIRTSLTIASAGVAVVQLFLISSPANAMVTKNAQRFGRPLGAVMLGLGLLVLAIGVTRYFMIQKALTEGEFPAARRVVMIITLILAALIASVFGIVVSGR